MPQGVNSTGPATQEAVNTATSVAVDPTAPDQSAVPRTAAAGPTASAPRAGHPAGGLRRLSAWLSGRRAETPTSRPALPEGAVIEPPVELPADDPLAGYLMHAAAAVDVRDLEFESPALKGLKDAGVVLAVPLISAGAPLGMLTLGPRLSGGEYSTDDRRLLSALARYAAPAIRVGQLVREEQAEALRRERIDQQLEVARLIQRQFLPESLPDLPGWQVTAFYRPAQTVGGDFYDFIPLPGGQVMVVIGDVTGKGVPAALVMASTHALLRAAAPRLISPGAVLETVNDLLWRDTPAHMFVTCLALVLDATSDRITFANAGHDVPYVRTADGVAELRAKGMPLGLMPGMTYEEKAFTFRPGDCALLHSDGLSEAHAADREMFGFHRVAALVGQGASGQALIDLCLTELDAFTGPGHEQEDDITLLSLEQSVPAARPGITR
jgi:serine phosphatase RsbU (regulator of sigma subunit)